MFLIPDSYWEVRKTKHKGKGIFAKRDIEPGVVIGDYLGTVVKPDEEMKLEKKHGFYSMYYHENASIFPDLKKPGLHLFNHSCAPNCWMYTYKGHTLYFTIRKIFKGEELTISYMLSPIDEDCSPCAHVCKCESVWCPGTMHLSPKRYNAWSSYDDKRMKKTKMHTVEYGQELPALLSYPQSIGDHSLYTLFGSSRKTPLCQTDDLLPSAQQLRKRIRRSGRSLYFPRVKTTILGVTDAVVISQKT